MLKGKGTMKGWRPVTTKAGDFMEIAFTVPYSETVIAELAKLRPGSRFEYNIDEERLQGVLGLGGSPAPADTSTDADTSTRALARLQGEASFAEQFNDLGKKVTCCEDGCRKRKVAMCPFCDGWFCEDHFGLHLAGAHLDDLEAAASDDVDEGDMDEEDDELVGDELEEAAI